MSITPEQNRYQSTRLTSITPEAEKLRAVQEAARILKGLQVELSIPILAKRAVRCAKTDIKVDHMKVFIRGLSDTQKRELGIVARAS